MARIWKLLLLAGGGVALLILLLALFLVVEHYRGKAMLASYRKALIAKGEKMTAADLATPIGEAQNGAPALWKAVEALGTNDIWSHLPGAMRQDESGQTVVSYRRDEWTEDKTNYSWNAFQEALASEATAMDEVAAALQFPVFENHLDYDQGPELLLPHLMGCRKLAQRLGVAAQLALRKGATTEAANKVIAQIRLTHALEQDHLLISELVRIAVAHIARTYTWEALQADGWKDDDLARMAKAWDDLEFTRAMAKAMEGERIYAATSFRLMRESNAKTVQYLYWMEDSGFNLGLTEDSPPSWWNSPGPLESFRKFLRNEVYCRVWRFAWLDQNHTAYLHTLQKIIDALRDATTHKSNQRLQAVAEALTLETIPHGNYEKLRMPIDTWAASLVVSLKRPMRVETERSLVRTAIALKRYKGQHQKFPETLEALVPKFLPSVPIDFMDGKPLRYTFKEGAPILYTVGEDGVDDGGDESPMDGKSSVLNVWNRRDFVWPLSTVPTE